MHTCMHMLAHNFTQARAHARARTHKHRFGEITPRNDIERTVVILAMLVGGAFYAYVVGSFTMLMQKADPLQEEVMRPCIEAVQAWMHVFCRCGCSWTKLQLT